jgi:glycerol-3-phosphate dehydrogenase (NAD(P)+)
MSRLAILGGGSWGTALSIVLAPRFDAIHLWVRRPELVLALRESRENTDYLPGFAIPPNVLITAQLPEAVHRADLLLSVLPSHAVRAIFCDVKSLISSDLPIISATKGLEAKSLFRVSEIIQDATGSKRIAVLSGPSFAREAAAGFPTAVVLATADQDLAEEVQSSFSGPLFRVYTSNDPVGVELGGAYKNVVAIGAGVCNGCGLGHNALAALITRGLAEMTRLSLKMGAQSQTLSGLSGLGDLVLTCTGGLSRNHQVGRELAAGRSIGDILSSMTMVAEGVGATSSIVKLGDLHSVDLPIATQMDAVLHSGRSPREAIRLLLDRALKNE